MSQTKRAQLAARMKKSELISAPGIFEMVSARAVALKLPFVMSMWQGTAGSPPPLE